MYIQDCIWYYNPFPLDEEVELLYRDAWIEAEKDTEMSAERTAAVNSQASSFSHLVCFDLSNVPCLTRQVLALLPDLPN
jgi:hypothetical protein